MPLLLTLNLVGGEIVSTKQNLLTSFSRRTFQLSGMKFCLVVKQFKVNVLSFLLSEVSWIKGRKKLLLDSTRKKNVKVGRHLHVYELINILVQTWYDDINYCILHLDTSVCDLDLDSRSWGFNNAKTSTAEYRCLLSPRVMNSFGWNLAFCWELLVWWISIFKGESPA